MDKQGEKIDSAVVVEMFKGLESLINQRFKENEDQHKVVVKHQEKTNGRVTRLEEFKNRIIGALVIMNLIFLPIAFIFFAKVVETLS